MAGRRRALSDDQVQLAQELRQSGYTKRKLAEYFEVGGTTIWDNIFATERPKKPKHTFTPTYSTIRGVVVVVTIARQNGLNSEQVSRQYFIPLEEVNHIYSNHGTPH